MFETIMPKVRLLPPARLRACRLGWYLSSSIALITRARVDVLTTLALLSTRETVAVETLARRATCSRFMSITLYKKFPDWQVSRQTFSAGSAYTCDPGDTLYENLTEPRTPYISRQCLGYQCL